MAPKLALSYSSQAPIYGGIAAGWSISGLPIISLDTSNGRLGSATKRYTSSMAGGRHLVPVTEPTSSGVAQTYRAQNDSSWTRYERMGTGSSFWWRAYSTDGTVHTFGDSSNVSACTSGGFNIVNDEYAPLTRQVDKFGNTIDYVYAAGLDNECLIDYVIWGHNSSGQQSFAAVDFKFHGQAACPGMPHAIGSQISWRSGTKIATGTQKLTSIEVTAFPPGTPGTPVHTRVITLGFDANAESCSARHSAYRSLASIQEKAWGTDSPLVDLPAIQFTYGTASFGTGALTWVAPQGTTQIPWDPTIVPGINNSHYNLGWGYRFKNGQWPTVEAMMIDVDGDGLLDRLSNAPVQGGLGSRTSRCRARWERNLGFPNGFANPAFIEMPTIKWAVPGHANYSGGAYAGEHPTYGNNATGPNRELCALNYQLSGYVNSFETSGEVVCPLQETCNASTNWVCSSTRDDCSTKNIGPGTISTILAFRWMDMDGDGKVDLVASPTKTGQWRYNLQKGNKYPPFPTAPWEPALFGDFDPGSSATFPTCPSQPFSAYSGQPLFPADPSMPFTMCQGMFPWIVYLNKGNGVFGVPQGAGTNPHADKIIYQPIPLESTGGDASLTSSPTGQYEGTADLDGDGYVDAVRTTSSSTTNWQVYRNKPEAGVPGAFVFNEATASPFLFGVAVGQYLTRSAYDPLQPGIPVTQEEGLADFNGDGLTDHWREESGAPHARLNNGVQFGSPYVLQKQPAADGLPNILSMSDNFIESGFRTDLRRILDIDLDGRVDVIDDPNQGGQVLQTFFNQGSQFTSTGIQIGTQTSLDHRTVVSSAIPHYWPSGETFAYSWEQRSDHIDLDGDGIPEGIDFGQVTQNPGTMYVWQIARTAQPPRLLIGINSQRGATTSVAYAPTAKSTAVVQTATKTVPHNQWVVESHTTTDVLAVPQTVSTTSYKYTDPQFSADDEKHFALRGFGKIETTLPSGAVRDDRYDFSVDWSGRLQKSIMHPAEDLTKARTVDITTWEPRTLFGGALTTYHPTVQQHYVCFNAQTDATCTATPASAAGYKKTTSTLTPLTTSLVGGGPQLMYQETQSLLQSGAAVADGDRRSDTAYHLHADGSNYRLVTITETDLHRVGGSFTTYAKTVTKWDDAVLGDTSARVPYETSVWADNDPSHVATTRRAYDLTTGNVTMTWKPVQWAANENPLTNLNRTTFEYDSRKLFVSRETNEIGHVRDHTYEYGTGTKLETQGPNLPACAYPLYLQPPQPHFCGQGDPLKEVHKTRVDGLGRMIERYETASDDGNFYKLRKMETNVYVDGPYPTALPSITHESAIEFVDATQTVRYARDTTALDGHGRPIRKTVSVFGSAPTDQITTFAYRNDGTLSSVNVPDPTQNNAATVQHTYTFDSLGRATGIRRPDTTVLADRSGVDITYEGLTQTQTEFVKAGDGERASTITKTDVFGRLIEVQEKRVSSPIAWAVTSYLYDPNDNVKQITDAQGAITTLGHDFRSQRTSISRAGKTWTYGYDKNGNLISELSPCTAPNCAALYTNWIFYDALDRVSSRNNAPRTLSAADLALFGSSVETFQYDGGNNGKGRLTLWKSFAPGAGTPTLQSAPSYNAQGLQTQSDHLNNAADYTNLSRQFLRFYNLAGGVTSVYYRDVVGTQNCINGSLSQTTYDPRGLPTQVQIVQCLYETTPFSYMTNTRNVAGLVTRRYSQQGVGTITNAESNWTYDKLGRVTSQIVKKGAALDQVVRQDLAYFGNDNPKSLDHWLGQSNQKHFNFTYDPRHQLTNVAETQLPNAFNATYAYGVAGRFASANETAAALPNSNVRARNVTYQYSPTDPEQLVTLKAGSKNWATYTYDVAGNQLTRTYPSNPHPNTELTEYVYDGKNQLRRATKKINGAVQGSEEYWYDENGARTLVVKRSNTGAKTGMIWFIGDTEAHYNPVGTVTKVYGHVAMGTPVFRIERNADAASFAEYQFHGLASNTIATVDQVSGTINASFNYAPFGEVIEATNGGGSSAGLAVHRRRMNDKFVDDIDELAYYGFRYYDRTSMSWTQGDPLFRFEPDRASNQPRRGILYAFSLQNSLRYQDPDGRMPVGVGSIEDRTEGVTRRYDDLLVLNDTAQEVVDVAVTVGRMGIGFVLKLDDSPDRGKSQEPSAQADADPQSSTEDAEEAKTPTADHRKNKRESNREKHEKGDERRKRDKGGEKGDDRRRPPRKKPPGWRGPWPPPGLPPAGQTDSESDEAQDAKTEEKH